MDMKPPFVQFPTIPWGSIGWRMGQGESYWLEWREWFLALLKDQREAYKSRWPEQAGWIGLYALIEHGTLPPHVVEERRLTELAAGAPEVDEAKITDKYRCRWLMTRYLKPTHRSVSGSAAGDLHFVDPDGGKWVFVVPTSSSETGYLQRLPG